VQDGKRLTGEALLSRFVIPASGRNLGRLPVSKISPNVEMTTELLFRPLGGIFPSPPPNPSRFNVTGLTEWQALQKIR
jgi:hypothetical protein